jgi:phage terminase small subunit
MVNELTEKQEKFAKEYILNLGNATAAYRAAYDTENMQESTIWTEACLLKQNQKVAKRIEELQQIQLEGYKIAKDYLAKELVQIVEESKRLKIEGEGKDTKITLPDPELRRKTIMDIAKLYGHLIDKKEDVTDYSKLLDKIKNAK